MLSQGSIINMHMRQLLLFVVFFIVVSESFSLLSKMDENVIADTPSGKLKGLILKTWTNKPFLSFRGVQFAEPPIGDLRFKAPVSIKSWNGIRDATEDGKICPQNGMDFVGPADENCLNLNVYTKNLHQNRPVIVFFHPGAFYGMTGASYWTGPQYLMDQDIVFVTVNYRLDALGYLSTGDENVPGNNGMKDQVEALRWIKKHIASFGGDPNKVTIAGYSAGSTSGFLHMLSPMSKGLFHNVIAMSAGVTSDWVITKDPLKYAKKLASLFNCTMSSTKNMVECLKKVPARDINTKFNEMRVLGGIPMVVFGPVIEPDLGNGAERFLTDTPISLIKRKQFHHVPVVTGVTLQEFVSWSLYVLNNETMSNQIINNFDTLAPSLFGYSEKNSQEIEKITKSFKKFYFDNKPITKESFIPLGKLYSDYSIIYGEHITTRLLAKYNEKPVYSYLLTYEGRYSHAEDPKTKKTYGPSHHDDLIYLFYSSKIFPKFNETDPEAKMVKTETTFWKNFATTGNPTPDGSKVDWTPFTTTKQKYLNIGSELKMEDGKKSPFIERMKLWESLFPVGI